MSRVLNAPIKKELGMNPELATSILKPWREAYQIALFEADKSKLSERFADAELALERKARELIQTKGDHIEEETSMEDAMYALHALKTIATIHKPPFPIAAGQRSKFDSLN
jgi:hypothetical protein